MQTEIKEIVGKYNDKRGSLIPILQDVQKEYGYISRESISSISELTKIPKAEIFGVVTFYAQFSTQPKGKHIVQVCDGTACYVRGATEIVKKFRKALQIPEGETTSEDLFVTLETVSCLGACALAPAVVVDGKVYGNVNFDDVAKVILNMKENDNE